MGRIRLEPWRKAWGLSARRNGGSVATTGARYSIIHGTQDKGPECGRVHSRWGEHLWQKNGACQHCHHPATDAREDRGILLPSALRLTSTIKPSPVTESGTYRETRVSNLLQLPLRGTDTKPNDGLLSTGKVFYPREAWIRSEMGWRKEGMLPEGQRRRLHHLQGRSSSVSSVASCASLRLRLKLLHGFSDSVSTPLSQFGSERFDYGSKRIFERYTVARGILGSCAQNSLTPFVGSSSHCSFAKGLTSTSSSAWSRGLACAQNSPTPFVASSSHCSFPKGATSSSTWFPGLSCAQSFLTPFVGSSSHCSFSKGAALSSTWFPGLACAQKNLTPFVASSSHCSFPKGGASSSTWFRGLAVPSKLPSRSADRAPSSTASQKQQQAADNDKTKEGPRINFEIKAPLVRLVGTDENGNTSHEVLTRAVALMRSQRAGMDLVEINPSADPPVCKILDYTKYRYELKKKEKDARKRQVEKRRVDVVKNVQIGSRTEPRDLELKVKQAAAHLLQGHRVKLLLIFRSGDRGRGVGTGMLDQALGMLEDVGIVEVVPKDVGQHGMAILRPKAAASAAPGSSASSSSSSS